MTVALLAAAGAVAVGDWVAAIVGGYDLAQFLILIGLISAAA